MEEFGKTIIILGAFWVCFGGFLWILGKLPFMGKLPGDIFIKKENFSLYTPIASMLLISLIISIILTIFSNLKK